jgi:type VI protein secretion system component Hcp
MMKRNVGIVGVLVVVAVLVGALAVPAVVAAPPVSEVRFANAAAAATSNQWFLKFLGVNGEVSIGKYEKWTAAHGVSWELDAPPTVGPGAGTSTVTPVAVTIDFDLGALPILQRCDDGEVTQQVLIDMTFESEGNLLPYTKYKLTDVTCRYYSIASSPTEARPLVTLLLEFHRMTITYLAYNEAGVRIGLRQHELEWR